MALATVADLKSMLSIQHSDDDALLTRFVSAASDFFVQQVSRPIEAADYTETLDGTGGAYILPRRYPVISVASVTVNGATVDPSTSYDVTGWYLSEDVIRLRGMVASEGTGNVEIAYRAGYETVPPDVSQAVLELAALMYRERDRVGQQSRNDQAGSTVFYYAPPARVVSTIEAYRRVA